MTPSEQKVALSIPDHLVRVFRSALSLPEEDLRKVNGWARSNVSALVAGDFDPESVAEQLGISRASVYPTAQAITSVLFLSERPGTPDLEGLAPGLNEIGEGYSAKARILLDGVVLEASEAEFIRQKGFVSQVVVPTLDNITAVCDLRSVFKYLPSASTAKSHQEGVSTLLGFEPIAIVAIELNDASGNDSASTFQVNEKGLRGILRTLEQCLMQLEMMREHQKSFVRGGK